MNAGFSNLDTLKKHLLAGTLKNDLRFDAVIRGLGLGVAQQFGSHCNRKFARVAGYAETFPADRAEFVLSRLPVETVTLSEVKLTEADGWVTQDTTFIRAINLAAGIINIGSGDAGPHYAQVRFTYTGGYWWDTAEPDDATYPTTQPAGSTAIPDDLLNAWVLQCRHVWARMNKLGTDVLADKQPANTTPPEDFAPSVEKTLFNYTRMIF